MRTSRAVALVPVLLFVLSVRAEDRVQPSVPSPSPAGTAAPGIKVEVPEKDFVAPALPRKPAGLDRKTPKPADNPAAVLARLQRAAKDVRILEVWSLDPSVDPTQAKPILSRLYPFHGNYTIGRDELKDEDEMQKLLLAVIRSIAKGPDMNDLCFDPRHGLRIYGQKGFIDVLICYQCHQGVIFEGKQETWFSTSAEAEADFDAVFAELGLQKAD